MKKNQVIHFIGIGGIGMSALAKFYLSESAKVSGSDLEFSEITEELKKMGAKIYTGPHKASNVPKNADLVIYNAAIDKKNPEVIAARKIIKNITTPALSRDIKFSKKNLRFPLIPMVKPNRIGEDRGVKRYSEAVGELTKKYYTIAVAGAHGKSTTTAILAKILIDAGLDPTVIIGTKVKEFDNHAPNNTEGSNFKKGDSKYFIIEADEYAASFLDYKPDIAIITNIDKEHLDFYKNEDRVRNAFKKFMLNVKPGGFLVLNNDNKNVLKLGLELAKLKRFQNKIKWFSLRNKAVENIKNILQIPGAHNISNALAALRAGEILNIPQNDILKSVSGYGGAWRRFEYRGSINGAKIFDDYAHHPTEIKATLLGARGHFPHSRIWCVFQPHQHQRLSLLFNEFALSFDSANEVILLEPYEVSGRENMRFAHRGHTRTEREHTQKFTSFNLAKKIDSRMKNNVYYIPYKSELVGFLKKYTAWGDVIIMMGAGDIWRITKELI
ncbi:MAG: UDP-N-acetylmuramate-L-alanine ligase [Parcubacteria group bacterium GW2011_GWA2_42_14]|nr:MAG: UDP-N-acetylmuramate-L-alanine ligase [Parcubacteria group bacterium GW2011_GWA2_42_14]OHA00087.1 MAG: hypothetical protein A3D41_00440 [Candidatus Sungbacteria bacterium RIFCSPHIGHO2_02_FULL_41_12b]